ncbi:MAG: permease-like cell division protein FtsX [Streptosporangiaceae bacterium]
MRIGYAFSELGSGLRRNVTMTVAVIVTVWVSLVLFGVGMLIRSEVDLVKGYWYDKVQIAVFLCNETANSPQCADGGVTGGQKAKVHETLKQNPEVSKIYFENRHQAYKRYQQIYSDSATADIVKPKDLQESYRVRLKDPQEYEGVVSAVQGLPGVLTVQDSREVLQPLFKGLNGLQWIAIGLAGGLLVAAVLQIANTIRLTVFSRRREIGIMRLVGAPNFYIQLPFMMESIVASLVGALLACGTLAFAPGVTDRLRSGIRAVPWIGWDEVVTVMPVLLVISVLLAVIASLVTLRKYLRV